MLDVKIPVITEQILIHQTTVPNCKLGNSHRHWSSAVASARSEHRPAKDERKPPPAFADLNLLNLDRIKFCDAPLPSNATRVMGYVKHFPLENHDSQVPHVSAVHMLCDMFSAFFFLCTRRRTIPK